MSETMRFQSVEGQLGKTIVARLLPGSDMLDGIEEVCRQHNIKSGVILCSIGSLIQLIYTYPVSEATAKSGIIYSDPVVIKGPVEFFGGQGIICQSENDEYLIHFHASASDESKNIYGGHMLKGSTVLATIDLIINEISHIQMLRMFDDETGFIQFSPRKVN